MQFFNRCFRYTAVFIGLLFATMLSAETETPDYYRIKVMSYNILHGVNAQNRDQLSTQALSIKEGNVALVGLQEVDEKCTRSGNVDQMKTFAEILDMKYAFAPHFDYQGGRYGLGILSLYPLSDIRNDRITVVRDKGETSTLALLSAVVSLPNNQKIRFATVHMGLNPQIRMIQAKEILEAFKNEKLPVILTGDLNAEPDSPEIKLLEQEFVTINNPKHFTFPVGRPTKTIDYIMVNKTFYKQTNGSVVRYDAIGSDHYPVVGDVMIKHVGK